MSPKMILAYLKKDCCQPRWKNGDVERVGSDVEGCLEETVCYLLKGGKPGVLAR